MARTKYSIWCESFGLEELRRAASSCVGEAEIAAAVGLDMSKYRRWKKKYPEFSEAVELGRSSSDYAVVKALYKRATGYNVALNKTYKLKRVDYDPETGKKIREYEELATAVDETFVPGDIRAETFWLKNRQPEAWCDRPDKSVEDENEGGIIEIPEADRLDGEDGS